ncbi:MAG: DNA polymerase III subunit delta, partial [Aggregatilineales bacterium]
RGGHSRLCPYRLLYASLFEGVMAKASPTFYLLYGDDDIALDETLGKLRQSMLDSPNADLNMDEFDGEKSTVPQVLNAVSSFPFLADKRLIIVRGLISHLTRKGAGETGKKAMKRLIDELPDLPDTARLVLLERGNLRKDSKIVKLANSHEKGYCKAHVVPKDTTDWILQRARHEYNAEIEYSAASALSSVTGSDLRRADNELLKLVAYVNDERPITEKDVEILTPYVADANVFNMVDALIAGDGKKAISLLHISLEQNPRDPGFGLFALITRQFRLLLLTREYLDNGGSRDGKEIASAIGVRSAWQAEKISRQSRAFDIAQLETIYRRLQQYDIEMKTGQIAPRMALDMLVTGLAKR